MKKTGHLVRLELHRQIALIDADNVQVEVPLGELMPDLGQAGVREQIATMRQQIMQQAKATAGANEQARRIQDEYHRSLQQQKERARQFDHWLGAIARMKVGDAVSISCRPGKGVLTKVDLPGLRATVHVVGMDKEQDQDMELPLSELFPQTGPFARMSESIQFQQQRRHSQLQHGRRQGRQTQQGRNGPTTDRQQVSSQNAEGYDAVEDVDQVQDNRPMSRRDADSRAAKTSRHALLDVKPGEQVFVVPFNKRATLIRILADKDRAIVQSGIFEMQLPLADLEPLRDNPPAVPFAGKKPKRKKDTPKGQP
jgi:hypothetical protein